MRKTAFVSTVMLALCASLAMPGGWGCGGGGGESAADEDAAAAEESFASATAALSGGDIASAREQYDAAAASAQAAIDGLSGLSSAGLVKTQTMDELLDLLAGSLFGGALTRQLLLADSTASQTLQDMLDFHNEAGPARMALSDVLGSGAFLDEHAAHKRDASNPEADVSGIPFTGAFLMSSDKLGRVLAFTPVGTTTSEVQDLIADLEAPVEEIIDLLAEAAENTGFTFTVPKELYFGDEDIQVSYADLLYDLAGAQMMRASLSLINTWGFDLDLGILYDEAGIRSIDAASLTTIMNENFFEMRSTAELAEAQVFLAQSLTTLLQALEATPSSDGFGNIEKDASTSDLFDQLHQIVDAANDSLVAAAAIPTTSPAITLDLHHLFTSPPSADTIGIDPFVLESGGIKPVEAFFNAMMQDVVFGMTLPVSSFSIFSTTLSGSGVRNAVFNEFSSFPPFR